MMLSEALVLSVICLGASIYANFFFVSGFSLYSKIQLIALKCPLPPKKKLLSGVLIGNDKCGHSHCNAQEAVVNIQPLQEDNSFSYDSLLECRND